MHKIEKPHFFPAFYFQIDKSINYRSIEPFIENTNKFAGYIFDQNKTVRKILLKYPSAFFARFVNNKKELSQKKTFINGLFIVLYKDFDEFISDKYSPDQVLICFDVILTKRNLKNPLSIIDQLQEYFLFSAKHPEWFVAVRVDFLQFRYFKGFYELMNKIGIDHFILKFKADTRNNIVPLIKKASEIERTHPQSGSDKNHFFILRDKVDALDNKLIKILSERNEIIKKMRKIKNRNNITYYDPVRWGEILESRKRTATINNLDEDLIEKIFEAIHLNNLKLMLREKD